MCIRNRNWQGLLKALASARIGLACLISLSGLLTGCQVFEQPVATATQPALNWLANLGEDQTNRTRSFELNSIRPAPHIDQVQAGDLLEVTVSNLFHPEEPHTFPARIHPDGSIEVPLLTDPVVVAGQTRAEIEKQLAREFQLRELLINPSIIVRNLEVPQVKVFVEGAVDRPGMIPLPREEASVYAALVSAGGLKTNAGSHISIASRIDSPVLASTSQTTALFSVGLDPVGTTEDSVSQPIPGSENVSLPTSPEGRQFPNSLSLPIEQQTARPAMSTEMLAPEQLRKDSKEVEYQVIWFDVHREDDRRALVEWQLSDGDIVSVSEMAPPVKIMGTVRKPGPYEIPNSNSVTLLDALALAGGTQDTEEPLTVTVMRPTASGWPGRRWVSRLDQLREKSDEAPVIRPGDVIQVERATSNKLKHTVQGWLGK